MEETLSEEEVARVRSFYKLAPHPFKPDNDKELCFEVQQGPFTGCLIQFGKVQIMKDEEDPDQVKAKYEYDIIDIPDEIKDVEFSDEEGEQLEEMIGEILIVLLNDSQKEIPKQKIGFKSDTEDRDDNILTFTT
jgi:hypothetical protein